MTPRFGLQYAYGGFYEYPGGGGIIEFAKIAKEADDAEIELLTIPAYVHHREPIIPLAAAASATRKIQLSPIVLDVYTRSPIAMAKSFANLDELSHGRAVIGLGRGGQEVSSCEGIPFKESLKRISEYISILRLLVNGGRVDYDGKIFKVRDAWIGFEPIRKSIPIYMGAFAPRLLQLAGELADGVFLSTCLFEEYAKFALENISMGANRAGRSMSELEAVGSTLLSIADSSRKARERMRPVIASYLAYPAYETIIKHTPFADECRRIKALYLSGDRVGAASLVTDAMIDELAVAGTPNGCKDRLARFSELGIRIHRVVPLGSNPLDACRSAIHLLASLR